jgi:hypothetical protein
MRVPKSVLGLENVSSGTLLFLGEAKQRAEARGVTCQKENGKKKRF